ncbi:HNH endonuclease [Segniliparus rugosus]|uniref:HNH endonuclease n=1 Tax=Segniliparus rugosus TaxID=286804 RepID=UPI0012EC24C9
MSTVLRLVLLRSPQPSIARTGWSRFGPTPEGVGPFKGVEGLSVGGWGSSRRKDRLPPDWPRIRAGVLRDAGWLCQIRHRGCLGSADEVDHIRRGDDHSRGNLRAACSHCHGKKSSSEGNNRKRELRALRKRPVERHPGSSR